MEIFWKTIAYYNYNTWIYQILLLVIGYTLVAVQALKKSQYAKYGLKLYLIAVSLWIAIAYYQIYCNERRYNDVMSIFWSIIAIAWIWDLFSGYTTFESEKRYKVPGYILLLMPLIFPAISIARGLEFPSVISPMMPCSVVIFTFGLLLLFPSRVNLFIVLLLCHWSFIGLYKTFQYRIFEDYIIAVAAIPSFYIFVKRAFLSNLNAETKPSRDGLKLMLKALCAGIVTVFIVSVIMYYR